MLSTEELMLLNSVWRRLLDCEEFQSVSLIGDQPEHSLEELMLKLNLQYFGHLMWKTYSLGNSLMLEKINARGVEGDNRG